MGLSTLIRVPLVNKTMDGNNIFIQKNKKNTHRITRKKEKKSVRQANNKKCCKWPSNFMT